VLKGTLYKRGETWYYECKSLHLRRSLKTSDQRTAQTRARDQFGWVAAVDDEQRAENLMYRFEQTKHIAEQAAKQRLLISDIWPRYLQVLKVKAGGKHRKDSPSGLCQNSLNTTKGTLAQFIAWLTSHHSHLQHMAEITPAIAEQYAIALRDRYKAGSFNRHLADLQVVFRRLINQAGLSVNPWEGVEKIGGDRLRAETASKRPFSPAQLELIWAQASGWIRPAVAIGYYTALRLGTISTLRWSEIDTPRGIITAQEQKTGKRGIFHCPEAMPAILHWRDHFAGASEMVENAQQYVFPRLAAAYLAIGRKRDTTRASKEFQRFLTDLHIDTHDTAGKTVLGFHSLRVSHATYAAGAGATMDEIQASLMHSNPRITAGYVQRPEEDLIHSAMQQPRPLPLPGPESTELISLRAAVMRQASTASIEHLRRMLNA